MKIGLDDYLLLKLIPTILANVLQRLRVVKLILFIIYISIIIKMAVVRLRHFEELAWYRYLSTGLKA
jgi:hypothetical protein